MSLGSDEDASLVSTVVVCFSAIGRADLRKKMGWLRPEQRGPKVLRH